VECSDLSKAVNIKSRADCQSSNSPKAIARSRASSSATSLLFYFKSAPKVCTDRNDYAVGDLYGREHFDQNNNGGRTLLFNRKALIQFCVHPWTRKQNSTYCGLSFSPFCHRSLSPRVANNGVVAALLVSGRPLGFVAILGILALLGMITKNAVILIGQIESERAQGKEVLQAVIDASSSRFRPIMLRHDPNRPHGFLGPMAFSTMGGLLVATVLTLVFLPTAYVAWFGDGKLAGVKS
jgi:hypothetical protein